MTPAKCTSLLNHHFDLTVEKVRMVVELEAGAVKHILLFRRELSAINHQTLFPI
jgi:hypothetical protein